LMARMRGPAWAIRGRDSDSNMASLERAARPRAAACGPTSCAGPCARPRARAAWAAGVGPIGGRGRSAAAPAGSTRRPAGHRSGRRPPGCPAAASPPSRRSARAARRRRSRRRWPVPGRSQHAGPGRTAVRRACPWCRASAGTGPGGGPWLRPGARH
jgi:hypothetical protein